MKKRILAAIITIMMLSTSMVTMAATTPTSSEFGYSAIQDSDENSSIPANYIEDPVTGNRIVFSDAGYLGHLGEAGIELNLYVADLLWYFNNCDNPEAWKEAYEFAMDTMSPELINDYMIILNAKLEGKKVVINRYIF